MKFLNSVRRFIPRSINLRKRIIAAICAILLIAMLAVTPSRPARAIDVSIDIEDPITAAINSVIKIMKVLLGIEELPVPPPDVTIPQDTKLPLFSYPPPYLSGLCLPNEPCVFPGTCAVFEAVASPSIEKLKIRTAWAEHYIIDYLKKLRSTHAQIAKTNSETSKASEDVKRANDEQLLMAKRFAEAIDDHRPSVELCVRLTGLAHYSNLSNRRKAYKRGLGNMISGYGKAIAGSNENIIRSALALSTAKIFGDPDQLNTPNAQIAPPDIPEKMRNLPSKSDVLLTMTAYRTPEEQLAAVYWLYYLMGRVIPKPPTLDEIGTQGGGLALNENHRYAVMANLAIQPFIDAITERLVPLEPAAITKLNQMLDAPGTVKGYWTESAIKSRISLKDSLEAGTWLRNMRAKRNMVEANATPLDPSLYEFKKALFYDDVTEAYLSGLNDVELSRLLLISENEAATLKKELKDASDWSNIADSALLSLKLDRADKKLPDLTRQVPIGPSGG